MLKASSEHSGAQRPKKVKSMFNSPAVKTVVTVLIVIAVLKMFGSKIPVVGQYIALS